MHPTGSQLSDFSVRTGGLYLIAFGVLLGAILLFGFRQDREWAWWAMWTFPVMAITASLLDLAFGDFFAGPATTGGIVGILAAAIPADQRAPLLQAARASFDGSQGESRRLEGTNPRSAA